MFTNIANKYGLVPQDSYPESVHSSNSRGVNKVLSRMFRTYVKDIYTNKLYSRQEALQKTFETLIKFFVNHQEKLCGIIHQIMKYKLLQEHQ